MPLVLPGIFTSLSLMKNFDMPCHSAFFLNKINLNCVFKEVGSENASLRNREGIRYEMEFYRMTEDNSTRTLCRDRLVSYFV